MHDDAENATRERTPAAAAPAAAGQRGLGEYRCVGCGYGILTLGLLPMCPMCHESTWTPTHPSPFTPRS